jgi:hypothetical protein
VVDRPRMQADIDGLLARVGELETCEHDADGFFFGFLYRTSCCAASAIRLLRCSQAKLGARHAGGQPGTRTLTLS